MLETRESGQIGKELLDTKTPLEHKERVHKAINRTADYFMV